MNYLIVKTEPPAGACRLRTIKNVPQAHHLMTGISRATDFPGDALFKMNETFPKDIRLVDSLKNQSQLLVVSERFKEALEAVPGALFQNEILPVKIVNHRGRTEKAAYFIVHQLDYPACLDETKSKGTRSTLDPKQFQFLKKMVLDTNRVPSNIMLFRAAQFPGLPLCRSDLAESLGKVGLTGFEFREIAGYEF